MSAIRDFHMLDLLKYNNVNLDPLTETYGMNFYMYYFALWPEYFKHVTAPSENANGDCISQIMGYYIGKSEGTNLLWHGHVSAVTVAPEYRRLGLASILMNDLEYVSNQKKTYFVDLFVRSSNQVAISMYEKVMCLRKKRCKTR